LLLLLLLCGDGDNRQDAENQNGLSHENLPSISAAVRPL
jgi:hypothetical protein